MRFREKSSAQHALTSLNGRYKKCKFWGPLMILPLQCSVFSETPQIVNAPPQICWPLHHSGYAAEVGLYNVNDNLLILKMSGGLVLIEFDLNDTFTDVTMMDFLWSPSSTSPLQVNRIYLKSSKR